MILVPKYLQFPTTEENWKAWNEQALQADMTYTNGEVISTLFLDKEDVSQVLINVNTELEDEAHKSPLALIAPLKGSALSSIPQQLSTHPIDAQLVQGISATCQFRFNMTLHLQIQPISLLLLITAT